MKAEVKYRVNMENHVELGTVAPLEEPFVIALDPSSACNFKCRFCPTGHHGLIKTTGRYVGNMDYSIFKKIVDDLGAFNSPLKTLRLYKNGEPLVNRNFPEMISYAKQSGNVQRVDTTTNGALLNPTLNRAIVDAGLDQINISVNGVSAEQIGFYTNTNIDFKEYVKNIKDLYLYSTSQKEFGKSGCEISIKAIKENLSDDEQRRFFEIFGDISDRIVLEHLSPAWPDFSLDDFTTDFSIGNYGQQAFERMVCPYIFYILVINADGTCSTCIGDWPNKQIIGDVRYESVKQIWNGERMNRYRLLHLSGQRKSISFCGSCEVITYGTLDNMDPYKDLILTKMRKKCS